MQGDLREWWERLGTDGRGAPPSTGGVFLVALLLVAMLPKVRPGAEAAMLGVA